MAEDPPIVKITSADVDMNAAIARARDTLPMFWASFDAPKPSETGHGLKVRFAVGPHRFEHIWMSEVEKLPDGNFSGRFANQPSDLPDKNEGDQVEFKQADITDWLFIRNGKVVGGETIKLLLKSMPKEEADAMRAQMEPLRH
ncbi:DUF2314 domain-containing protein [Bradyrhizobium sp. S69]|uniref:YegJ family protein n=1 Tax=Bradyrhizobium sp. S69 TaxID=1641856 RepID=UPI00131BE73E|nr:DUF2314 domain-containing protein [Bradyrhizobium sp. S69]